MQLVLATRIKVYTFITTVFVCVLFNLCLGLVLQPLRLLSPILYKKAISFLLMLSEPGFVCVPKKDLTLS